MKRSTLDSGNGTSPNVELSPPGKKSRAADFQAIVKRSHSVTEESIDMNKSYKEKIINDR